MTPEETLRIALQNGIIDLAQIQTQVDDMTRKELLEKHTHKIWQGSNGAFFTYVDEGGELVQRRRATKKALEDYLCEFYREQVENPTLRELFNEWNHFKLETKQICQSTFTRNDVIFRRHYGGKMARRHIRSIKPEEIRDFLEEQVARFDMTAKAFSNLKTITRGTLKLAKRKKLIDWSYEYMLSDIEISERSFKKTKKEDYQEVYSVEEQTKIMDYLSDNPDQYNCGLLLLFVSGIRVGELATLKPENIDESYEYIDIRHTETKWYDDDGVRHVGVKDFPKSEAGWRTVVVPSRWKWLLKRIKEMNPDGEWCFNRTEKPHKGQRINVQSFERRLRLVNKKLGIYQKSPHKIRKTYGSILLDEGVDQNFIIQQMGHASIMVTEQHYHRNRKSIDRKRAILDDIGDFNYGHKAM